MTHIAVAPGHVNSHAFAEMTGLTYRQVDYWTRQDILIPDTPATGSGTFREWSAGEIRIAKVLKQLSDLGMSWERMQVVAQYLRDRLRFFPYAAWAIVELTPINTLTVRVTTDNSTNGPAWVAQLPAEEEL